MRLQESNGRWVSLIIVACICAQLAGAGDIREMYEREHGVEVQDGPPPPGFKIVVPPPHGITEIGIERTGCFGRCPTYWAKIDVAAGSVLYVGQANTKRLGEHRGTVDQQKLERLCYLVNEIGYMNMSHRFWSPATDLQTVYTTVVKDGERKLIYHYGDTGPASLWAVEQVLDDLIRTATWSERPSKGQ